MNPQLEASSVLAWIMLNGFVNEGNKPIEFTNHRFLIDYMADDHPIIVTKKAAQIGLTVAESLRAFHYAAYKGLNVIHTLQTSDVIKGFVAPKINPIIQYNPKIKELVKLDSESLKGVGEKFIFYRGAQAESQAINITADVLNIDEYDRSNQRVVEIYQSRLDASEYKWKRYFSNPSAIGFGVDGLYNNSDQRHWMVTCKCGHRDYLDFEQVDDCHFVNVDKSIFACGKCGEEITNSDRINGEWIAKFPERDMHGYWFSQAMAPWVSAGELIQKQQNTTVEFFNNFVLGKAYTPTDLIVNRDTIQRAYRPGIIPKTRVAIGVDNGATKHWVAATPQGIFDFGKTTDWDDIERIFLMYSGAKMVIDALPDFTIPKRLVQKYKGKVFVNYFVPDTKQLGAVRWGKGDDYGVVRSDRTKIIDLVASEISEQKMTFRLPIHQMSEYISHWESIFRTLEVDDKGNEKGTWVKQTGNDHFAFATVYMRIALSKQLGATMGMDFAEPLTRDKPKADYVENGTLHTNLSDSIEMAMEGETQNDWRYQ